VNAAVWRVLGDGSPRTRSLSAIGAAARRPDMLECVLNISEGRDRSTIDALAAAAGNCLLDVHNDASHHRSVLTLAGETVEAAARDVTRTALARIDITTHQGAHPRLGVVDVVPFAPIGPEGMRTGGDLSDAIRARDSFCAWAGAQLALPCFLYGPERSLPDVRRHAFSALTPDCGPHEPHPTGGACSVGARPVLVAYNLMLADTSIGRAREVAASIRSSFVRALAFEVADGIQVSCNLIAPWQIGPSEVFDEVRSLAPIRRAELVGLVPEAVLRTTDRARWAELGLSEGATIELRLARTRATQVD
jgi:glutamate formiminotransferase / 5-formyltetrahydrofolate cyclo-ligase